MQGIGTEFAEFLLALLSGAVVRLTYRCISCFRQIVKHRYWAVEMEDFLFWTGSALYLFVQIYHTSDGSIRWHFILGIVLGAVFLSFLIKISEKIYKKMYDKRRKNFHKSLDKSSKNR